MDVDINIEGIAKDTTDKASRIAADESAKAANEGAAKDTAEEATKETTEAIGSIPASGVPHAIMAMEARVADETTTTINNHPLSFEAPS